MHILVVRDLMQHTTNIVVYEQGLAWLFLTCKYFRTLLTQTQVETDTFFNVVPLMRRHLSQPPSMVDISHFTHCTVGIISIKPNDVIHSDRLNNCSLKVTTG